MVEEKSWKEFRESGLLLLVNQFLHIFGWSIVVDISKENVITRAYPARVKFRGFAAESQKKAYIKVSEYMKENAEILLKESKD